MMRVSTIVFSILLASSYCSAQECISPSKRTDAPTCQGANLLVKLVEKQRKLLKGRIEDANGNALAALVEVFGLLHTDYIRKTEGNERIIACEVFEDGVFGFTGLKKGEYELRVSYGAGFNVSHIFLKVAPRGGKRKDLIVTATLGI